MTHLRLSTATIAKIKPQPPMDACIDNFRKRKFLSTSDEQWGYRQVPIKNGNLVKTTFFLSSAHTAILVGRLAYVMRLLCSNAHCLLYYLEFCKKRGLFTQMAMPFYLRMIANTSLKMTNYWQYSFRQCGFWNYPNVTFSKTIWKFCLCTHLWSTIHFI